MSEEDGCRLSCHHGRYRSPGHNDRQYSEGDMPPNIDPEKSKQNISWHCYEKQHPELTEDEAILKAYSYFFGKALDEQNARYESNRQHERVRTMKEFLNVKQHMPEETLFYVGNRKFDIDKNTLWKCYNEYLERERKWSKEHNDAYFVLTVDLHCDEQGARHVHERGVWKYKDERGVWHEGQEKALEQAGVPLPDPAKPRGRHNNRKISFDKMRRQWAIEIAKEHGLPVIEEPIKGRQDEDTEEYVRKQVEKQNRELQDVQKAVQEAQKQLASLKGDIKGLEGKKTHLERSESVEEALNNFGSLKPKPVEEQLGK